MNKTLFLVGFVLLITMFVFGCTDMKINISIETGNKTVSEGITKEVTDVETGGVGEKDNLSGEVTTFSCQNLCIKTQEMLTFSLETFEGTNICNNIEIKTMPFCTAQMYLGEVIHGCYDVTTCVLRDARGRECRINQTTCKI